MRSTTLYVGNLSFYTTEEQIYELFSKCGDVSRVIVGLGNINYNLQISFEKKDFYSYLFSNVLDRIRKTPCGFCFVEYANRESARNAMRYINGTKLDDRQIRTDWDTGFEESRQYGRGRSGGQVYIFFHYIIFIISNLLFLSLFNKRFETNVT